MDSSRCVVLQPRLVNVGQSSRASRLTLTIDVQKHHFPTSYLDDAVEHHIWWLGSKLRYHLTQRQVFAVHIAVRGDSGWPES